MKETATKLDSIDSYHRLYGLPESGHPLVSVLDLKKATKPFESIRLDYGIYALFLKNGDYCTVRYQLFSIKSNSDRYEIFIDCILHRNCVTHILQPKQERNRNGK